MQRTMPFRWIEEAEARTVIAATLYEQTAPMPRWRRAWRTVSRRWRPLAACFSLGRTAPCPALQPAVIRRVVPFRGGRYPD